MRLAWDKLGEKVYETGTDHGVLYLPTKAGVYSNGYAWNGLTAVTQSPEGAESNPSMPTTSGMSTSPPPRSSRALLRLSHTLTSSWPVTEPLSPPRCSDQPAEPSFLRFQLPDSHRKRCRGYRFRVQAASDLRCQGRSVGEVVPDYQ